MYGLDEELLEMVPKPVLAVLFLYPLTPQVCVQDYTITPCFSLVYASAFIFFPYDILLQSEEERIQQDTVTKVSPHKSIS